MNRLYHHANYHQIGQNYCPICEQERHFPHFQYYRKGKPSIIESLFATLFFLTMLFLLASCGQSKSATDYQKSALQKNHDGQYEAAIADCNEAIKLAPKYAEPYNNRGWAKYNLGHYDEAIIDFTTSIELNYSFIKPHVNRGNAYLRQGKFELAETDFNNALAINPNYKNAYKYKGDLYKAQGKTAEAEIWYAKGN